MKKIKKISFKLFNLLRGKKTEEDMLNCLITHNKKIINLEYNNIPDNLKDKIVIKRIGLKENKENIINSLLRELKGTIFDLNDKDCTIIDYFDFKQYAYIYPAHTDIQWNYLDNNGYNVWYLTKNSNKNNEGNLFIFDNDYLFNKYKNIHYSSYIDKNYIVFYYNDEIASKNRVLKKFKKLKVLEKIPLDKFLNETKIYYLNINLGDFIAFKKNLCHMTDIRNNKNRECVNFRLIEGKRKYKSKENKFFNKTDYYINNFSNI